MSQSFYIPPVITHIREDGNKNVFTCLDKLGQGGSAVIHKVKHQNTNKIYAMKIISKQYILSTKDKSTLERLKNEIQIQKMLYHPNIVQSKISFSDDFNYYIALEYCPGKNIRERLINSHQGHFSEPEARKILKDVLNGLAYIHRHKIIHYDIKLENFMIGSDGKVKIADFGLSTFAKQEDKKKNTYVCGTPNYMSPEILSKKGDGNGFASDIWSIGVSAFMLLTGKQPFAASIKEAIYNNIKNGQFSFPPDIPLSNEAKDFVKSILKLDPTKRPSALDLLRHPFMRKYDSEPIQLYNPNQSSQNVQIENNNNINVRKISSTPQIENNNNDIMVRKVSSSPLIENENNDQISPQFPIQNNYNFISRRSPNLNQPASELQPVNDDNPLKKPILNNKNEELSKNLKKNFTIPRNFVVKHSFLRDDLIYLLANGTVGICFNDKSRIILDPNEKFVQYYKNYFSPLGFVNLNEVQNVSREIDEKISLVKKFAKVFKKYTNLYEQKTANTVSTIPLYHVSSFIKKDKSVLYKFSNKNVQVDFSDGKKLIIFWSTKRVCISKNIKEKCVLYSQNDIFKLGAESDELIKYKNTKEMLNELARSLYVV